MLTRKPLAAASSTSATAGKVAGFFEPLSMTGLSWLSATQAPATDGRSLGGRIVSAAVGQHVVVAARGVVEQRVGADAVGIQRGATASGSTWSIGE